jgi:branched-chain amino acid transport system permease protein
VGIVVGLLLYLLFGHTRLGMQIRAGASNREMAAALGVNIRLLYTLVFGLGTLLAGLAGVMAGPILAVEAGMGESILIPTFVVIVIGGIGSIRGALIGALLVGLVDTLGRAFLPVLLRLFLTAADADGAAASLASMSIYMLMAAVLVWRPKGLIPAHGS